MPMLHTVNKSPFERDSLDSCIRLAAKGGSVLLIEDGVYAAMNGTAKSDLIKGALEDLTFYVLGPDIKARGLDEDRMIDGIKVVDYAGFVDLTTQHENVQAWL